MLYIKIIMEYIEKQWKTLIYQNKTYEQFEVSNYGELRNAISGHIYKLNLMNGYLGVCVSLGSRNNKKAFKIHKAVAETFIPNPNNLPEVNHITGDKTKNEAWNLEWCTRQENQIHAVKTGLQTYESISGKNNYRAKLSQEVLDYIRKYYIPNDKEFGCRALAKKFNVDHSTISRAINKICYKNDV